MTDNITDGVIRRVGANLRDEDAETRSEAARLLGSATSPAKAEAARENGRLGGRPGGTKLSPETRAKMAESHRRRWAAKKETG